MDKKILSIVKVNKWAMDLEAFKALQTNLHLTDASTFDLKIGYEQPKYNVVNGVAVIPVKGVLSKGVSDIEAIFFDIVDTDNVSDMFSKAERDETVESIVLDINSPGGSAAGIPELYDRISNSSKPVISYVDETCASGAYWIASASNAIYATKSADVGSVGCFVSFLDVSKYFENLGVKNEMIISTGSKYKGMGAPGTSLSDTHREQLQTEVDYINDMFHEDVNKNRTINPDDMAGQTFIGNMAEKAGYIDNVVDGMDTAMVDVTSLANLNIQTQVSSAVEEYNCSCVDCGHKMKSDKHCNTIKCPKCGGEMRRQERPGPGR